MNPKSSVGPWNITIKVHLQKKKFQNPSLGRKSLPQFFLDTDGVIHMDFLEYGTTINSQPLQCNTQNFETTIKKSQETFCCDMTTPGLNNSHTSLEATEKMDPTILAHPPYGPDLAPVPSTCSQKRRKTFMDIHDSIMRWKELSGPVVKVRLFSK
jgi:hypothetical protein